MSCRQYIRSKKYFPFSPQRILIPSSNDDHWVSHSVPRLRSTTFSEGDLDYQTRSAKHTERQFHFPPPIDCSSSIRVGSENFVVCSIPSSQHLVDLRWRWRGKCQVHYILKPSLEGFVRSSFVLVCFIRNPNRKPARQIKKTRLVKLKLKKNKSSEGKFAVWKYFV